MKFPSKDQIELILWEEIRRRNHVVSADKTDMALKIIDAAALKLWNAYRCAVEDLMNDLSLIERRKGVNNVSRKEE